MNSLHYIILSNSHWKSCIVVILILNAHWCKTALIIKLYAFVPVINDPSSTQIDKVHFAMHLCFNNNKGIMYLIKYRWILHKDAVQYTRVYKKVLATGRFAMTLKIYPEDSQ